MHAHPTLPFSFTNDRSKASSFCGEEPGRSVSEVVAEQMLKTRRAGDPGLLEGRARVVAPSLHEGPGCGTGMKRFSNRKKSFSI
jgi:hypothetical protein